MALLRNTWTGSINTNIVYNSGIYFFLPWKELILFDKSVHNLPIKELRLFTTDKLQVKVSFKIYYFIK